MDLLFVNLLGQGLMVYRYYLCWVQFKIAMFLINIACLFSFYKIRLISRCFEESADYFVNKSKANQKYIEESDDVVD